MKKTTTVKSRMNQCQRHICYVINLHSGQIVCTRTTRLEAIKLARSQANLTGCTHSVARGMLWFGPDNDLTKCRHLKWRLGALVLELPACRRLKSKSKVS